MMPEVRMEQEPSDKRLTPDEFVAAVETIVRRSLNAGWTDKDELRMIRRKVFGERPVFDLDTAIKRWHRFTTLELERDLRPEEIAQQRDAQHEVMRSAIAGLAKVSVSGVMMAQTFTLGRVNDSAWHRIQQRVQEGRFFGDDEFSPETPPVVFLVQHDWASAFQGADGIEERDVRLPFPACVFEMRVNNQRCCVLAEEDTGERCIYIDCGTDIFCLPYDKAEVAELLNDETLQPLKQLPHLIERQIHAICVALEAQVAESEETKPPEKLNKARARKGKPALLGYHVINLAKRHRAPRQASVGPPKWKVRLHFRRGHWRHYEDRKTWINWMLVGDPDLGFIDKHYQL